MFITIYLLKLKEIPKLIIKFLLTPETKESPENDKI